MRKSILLFIISFLLNALVGAGPALAAGFVSLDNNDWNESAVRRILHTFAYGSFATDVQIKSWAGMASGDAI